MTACVACVRVHGAREHWNKALCSHLGCLSVSYQLHHERAIPNKINIKCDMVGVEIFTPLNSYCDLVLRRRELVSTSGFL